MIKNIINSEGPVNEIFMVKQATRATSTNGSPYLSLTLQDVTGTIDAKMWSIDDSDLELAQPGALVHVIGMSGNYRGHPQLKINELNEVRLDQVDMAKYVPTAPTQREKMEEELTQDIQAIEDDDLRKLVETLLREHYADFITYPAAVTVHHAYLGGLLFHSLSICRMAIMIQSNYPYLSKDYLIAGALLHDIGKTKELSNAIAASYTTEGNLVGHIVIGAMMVHEKGIELHTAPEKLTVLTHMILAHHGEYEFGSPKLPATAEAYVLHSLDDLDAKMECLRGAYLTTNEGEFTARIPWMENQMFYKPEGLKKK